MSVCGCREGMVISRSPLLATLAAAVLVPGLGLAEQPSGSLVYLEDEPHHTGSGCPTRSVTAFLSEEREALSILLEAYDNSVGPDTLSHVSRKCDIGLPIHVPEGWQYALSAVEYGGRYTLDAGVTAEHESEYFFQGEREGPVFTSKWTGPTEGERFFTSADSLLLPVAERHWSPCNQSRDLIVRVKMILDNEEDRDGSGYVESRYAEGHHSYAISLTYAIAWRRCSRWPERVIF